jgi:hypothetical protein
MNKYQTTRTVTRSIMALAMITLFGGCASTRPSDRVPIVASDTPAQGPLALDIDNHKGSVTVEVVHGLKEPHVTAVVRGRESTATEHWAAASLASDAGRPVLRVLSAPPVSGPDPLVDIVVRVPDCAGIRVRSDEGQIILRGVGGAIDAQTSIGGRDALAIVVTTDTPLTDPVLLHAQRGGIELRVPRQSTGLLRADSPVGSVNVDAAAAELRDVRYTRQVWTGELNAGKADMRLTADDGDILVMVGR